MLWVHQQFSNEIYFKYTLSLFLKGIWIPELKNRVEKTSYGLWRHKTGLTQIVTSKLIFRNSETLDWKNEHKILSYVTRKSY